MNRCLICLLLPQRLVAISGCGHLPHEECPKALLAAVSPFICQVLCGTQRVGPWANFSLASSNCEEGTLRSWGEEKVILCFHSYFFQIQKNLVYPKGKEIGLSGFPPPFRTSIISWRKMEEHSLSYNPFLKILVSKHSVSIDLEDNPLPLGSLPSALTVKYWSVFLFPRL